MIDEMYGTLKDITSVLLAIGSAISLLSFAQGLSLHSFDSSAFLVFCAAWLVLNALSGQIELEVRKLLVSMGVPASIAIFAIAALQLALAT